MSNTTNLVADVQLSEDQQKAEKQMKLDQLESKFRKIKGNLLQKKQKQTVA